MARSKQQSGNGKTQPEGQRGIHAQLAGPQVVECIDRNIRQLETLVDEAESADREKLDQIRVQQQGLNYAIAARMKMLNKIIPDAQRTETSTTGPTTLQEIPIEDRMMAAVYGMRPFDFLRHKEAGTLPPRPPTPAEEGYREHREAERRGDQKTAQKYVKHEHKLLPKEERD